MNPRHVRRNLTRRRPARFRSIRVAVRMQESVSCSRPTPPEHPFDATRVRHLTEWCFSVLSGGVGTVRTVGLRASERSRDADDPGAKLPPTIPGRSPTRGRLHRQMERDLGIAGARVPLATRKKRSAVSGARVVVVDRTGDRSAEEGNHGKGTVGGTRVPIASSAMRRVSRSPPAAPSALGSPRSRPSGLPRDSCSPRP